MENRTDKRAQRGGLPLLFALILGLSLLLHTAGMLAMGGWHGIADPAFLKGDLSRYPGPLPRGRGLRGRRGGRDGPAHRRGADDRQPQRGAAL